MEFVYADIAGQCRRQVILEAFGEGDVNLLSVEGECCDVCDEEVKHLRDCHKELEVAVDAIEAIGSKGEVKLT